MRNSITLKNCLAELKQTTDVKRMDKLLDRVDQFILDSPENIEVFFEFLNQDATSRSKWGVLETLNHFSREKENPQLTERLLRKIITTISEYSSGEEVNEYLYGSIIQLRMLPIPQEDWQRVADLMRTQIRKTHKESISSGIHNRIFGQSLLVLGSYGNASDVPLIAGIIEGCAPKYQFIDLPFESLRRIISFNPNKIGDSESVLIRMACSGVLSQYVPTLSAKSKDMQKVDNFCKSARATETLCARLYKEELDLGEDYAIRSQSPSLASCMTRDIQEAIRYFQSNGQLKWLANHIKYANVVYERLKEAKTFE